MTITTIAIVNGALVVALLAGLVYVCSIPFSIGRPKPVRKARLATGRARAEPAYKRTAA